MKNDSAVERTAWPSRGRAFYTLSVVTVAYVFAILDRVSIGLFIEPIKQDLQLTDTQIGLLQGLAFSLLYTILSFPMGYLGDRTNRVNILAGSVLVWSAGAVGCGLAGSFFALFMARVILGAGESGFLPLSNSLISDYFSPKDRGRAFSIFVFGSTIGTAASYLLGALAIEAAHDLVGLFGNLAVWQIAFILIGAPGLLVAPLLLLTVREPVRQERSGGSRSATLAELLRHLRINAVAYAAIITGAVLNGAMVAAQTFWYPSLFIRVYGWAPEQFGKVFAAFILPNGIIAMLSVGWVLSRLARGARRDGPVIVLLVQLGVWGLFGVLKALAPTPYLSLAFNIATGVTGIWSMTAAMTALSQITPNEMRGQVTAIYAVCTGLISYSLGAAAVGLLTDHVFGGGMGIGHSLATVYGVCGFVGALALVLGRKAYIQAVLRSEQWSNPRAEEETEVGGS